MGTTELEDAAPCLCAGCVHTPGTQTENRPLRGTERKIGEEKRRRERPGGVGGETAKKEGGGGERGARNLRASVLRPSWGVAAGALPIRPSRCIS